MSDKIAEIRARHEDNDSIGSIIHGFDHPPRWTHVGWKAHHDRAFLLLKLDRVSAGNERLRAEVERLRRDRRERIATAALQGILACHEGSTALPKEWPGTFAIIAVDCADALIAELDKEGKS